MLVPTAAGAPGAPVRQCPNSWRPGSTSSGSDDVRGAPAGGRALAHAGPGATTRESSGCSSPSKAITCSGGHLPSARVHPIRGEQRGGVPMRRLSGTDTLMLYSENAKAQNIIAPVTIYDASTAPGGRVTLEDVLRFVQSRLHVSESFREKLVRVPFGLGNPYWVRDADFDLEYHVRHISLPRPGSWEQFTAQVSRIGQRALDMDRPPWELWLIDGLDAIEGVPPGAFAVLLKLHHAAVDGVAGTEIVNALHDHDPDAAQAAVADDTWRPDARPSDLALVARAAAHVVVEPIGAARRLLWPTLRMVPGAAVRRVRPAEGRNPSLGPVAGTRFNRPVGAHRVWDARRIPFADVKEIRKAVPGASINDVVMALVGGSVRIYLQSKDELPRDPWSPSCPSRCARPRRRRRQRDRPHPRWRRPAGATDSPWQPCRWGRTSRTRSSGSGPLRRAPRPPRPMRWTRRPWWSGRRHSLVP